MVDKVQERAAKAYEKAQQATRSVSEKTVKGAEDGLDGLLGTAEIVEPTTATAEKVPAVDDTQDEGTGLLDTLKDKVNDVLGWDNT